MADTKLKYWAARGLIWLCGLAMLAFMLAYHVNSESPIVWHSSAVYPTKVRAGEIIEITRDHTYTRDVLITILRRIETGDCSSQEGCKSYPLDSSSAFMKADRYNKTIPHRVPARALPGRYKLIFSVNWQWWLFHFSVPHPVLEIEVVP
jgi:hypothetical protein